MITEIGEATVTIADVQHPDHRADTTRKLPAFQPNQWYQIRLLAIGSHVHVALRARAPAWQTHWAPLFDVDRPETQLGDPAAGYFTLGYLSNSTTETSSCEFDNVTITTGQTECQCGDDESECQ